jgi:hypothetical protein
MNVNRLRGALLLIPVAAFAADTQNWANLESLRIGDRIGIIQSDLKRVEGQYQGSTDAGLTIHADQNVTLAKDSVVRVYRRPHLSRKKRVLLGAAIGAAAGGAVGGGLANASNNEGFFGYNGAVGVTIGGGAGVGAAIGAATGGGYHTVYQRK